MNELENLEKLYHLRDRRVINDTEFESLKIAVIGQHLGLRLGARSGTAYALLAWFLGIFGAHNFYAGYTKRAIVQILITLFSGLLFFAPIIIVQLWALGDLCLINKDAEGTPFYGDKTLIRIIRIAAVALYIFVYFFGFISFISAMYIQPAVISLS